MTNQRFRLLLTLAVAPLALAACKQEAATSGDDAPKGEAIAAIAAPAGTSWTETFAKTADGGYLVGNPNAPIKLVEYGALSCSHCAEFSETSTADLRGTFVASGKVSYELRFFMLNGLDIPATLLATCGSTEAVLPLAEQFWAWQPNMFASLKAAGDAQFQAAGSLPPNQRFAALAKIGGMDSFFAARGIPQAQAASCLADVTKATALADATNKAGTEKGINGTPTFFLNGTKLNEGTWPGVKTALQAAGAR